MSTESKECSWASVGGVRFRDALIGVLVIGAAIASMYAYVFDEPESLRWLGIGDANIETGPMAFAMDDAIHRGEVPLWNPLSFCGTPFAANPAHSLFYPPNLIRSLATSHPTPFRTHAGILVLVACHLLLAGVGTFLFARHQRLSRPASFVAAFAFVLSSPFIYRTLGHWRMMFVASWLPMLLAALAAALDARALRRKIFFALIAALAFGMACLVGAPQMFTTMGFLAAVYCAVYRLLHWPKRADMSGTLSRDASAMAVFVVVGVLIAAAALVPGAELAGFSARTKGDAEHAFARTEERPDWNAFQLLATYSGSATDSGLRFTGAGVLILALCAWLHADRRRMLVHAALFYVALDCSLGPPFPFARLLVAVAPFAMSQPQRAALFACFFLGLLAGFGLDALTTRRDTRAAQWRAAAAAIASGIIVLYTLEGCANPHPFLDVSKAVLVLPAAVAVLGTVASFMSTGRVPKVLLAALVFAEIWTWNTEFIPHYWRGRRAEVPGDVAYLKAERSLWSDNTRGADPHPNWWVY
ncbi:MAG TPA: hypothetical protein PK468_21335, partial [Candidatus Hydrogenedentes bacterium]|nr:hypothetical protein [Candidatus Hydrogenedentota bacterium]